MSDDELIEIEERAAIEVEHIKDDATAQAAWEFRVEKAKQERESTGPSQT